MWYKYVYYKVSHACTLKNMFYWNIQIFENALAIGEIKYNDLSIPVCGELVIRRYNILFMAVLHTSLATTSATLGKHAQQASITFGGL